MISQIHAKTMIDPITEQPEAIPKEQVPPFAREEGAAWTANGYDWKTEDVEEDVILAHAYERRYGQG